MSTLHFQQIVDSRQRGDSKALLDKRVEEIKDKLAALPDVTVRVENPRKVYFGPPEPSVQWRVDFYVRKTSRATTWDDIYRAVNSVKAVPYSFER